MPIGKASVATIISSQGLGDLYRLYLQAERNDLDYNLAFIPADVQAESRESFDAKYMRTLFDLGYTMARDGYPWEKSPPGITE